MYTHVIRTRYRQVFNQAVHDEYIFYVYFYAVCSTHVCNNAINTRVEHNVSKSFQSREYKYFLWCCWQLVGITPTHREKSEMACYTIGHYKEFFLDGFLCCLPMNVTFFSQQLLCLVDVLSMVSNSVKGLLWFCSVSSIIMLFWEIWCVLLIFIQSILRIQVTLFTALFFVTWLLMKFDC